MMVTRAAAFGLAALISCATAVIVVPRQAGAATAYRYWSYYIAHGTSWQYSQRGPATEYPVDGEVQGWRFAIQADAGNGLPPRAAPDFATLCAAIPAKAGELRVGVVIDFGLATDAPAHERPPAGVTPGCVYVHNGATGADVLEAAATIRIGTGSDAGLVCGIDGYPKTECAVVVAAHTASPTSAPAPASPRVTPSTHPPTTTATASVSSAGPPSASAPAQSSEPAPAQSAVSATSLAALRSSTRHNRGIPVTTIAGIALIVILGAGALWLSRVRGR